MQQQDQNQRKPEQRQLVVGPLADPRLVELGEPGELKEGALKCSDRDQRGAARDLRSICGDDHDLQSFLPILLPQVYAQLWKSAPPTSCRGRADRSSCPLRDSLTGPRQSVGASPPRALALPSGQVSAARASREPGGARERAWKLSTIRKTPSGRQSAFHECKPDVYEAELTHWRP